jgi:hypothetical protein
VFLFPLSASTVGKMSELLPRKSTGCKDMNGDQFTWFDETRSEHPGLGRMTPMKVYFTEHPFFQCDELTVGHGTL